jgi:hypothetical protein
MDLALRLVQVLVPALLFEHIVEGGHREGVVGVKALCAVRVELRPEVTDRAFLRLRRDRKRIGPSVQNRSRTAHRIRRVLLLCFQYGWRF